MPNTLLRVKVRLVGRQVLQMHIAMLRQVFLHQRSFVPGRSVHPQMDDFSAPASAQLPQQPQEPLSVALGSAHHPVAAFPGIDPTKDVEPLPVFTARGHAKGYSLSRPHPAEARMLGESGLVFKDQHLVLPQLSKFFYPTTELLDILGLGLQVDVAGRFKS